MICLCLEAIQGEIPTLEDGCFPVGLLVIAPRNRGEWGMGDSSILVFRGLLAGATAETA